MKLHYRLFRRGTGIFFVEDRATQKQTSLRTRDRGVAQRLFHARNEAEIQLALNLQIAKTYLSARDPVGGEFSFPLVSRPLVAALAGADSGA